LRRNLIGDFHFVLINKISIAKFYSIGMPLINNGDVEPLGEGLSIPRAG
jgi:hypothetical protein